jgi:hypothetical protein
MPTFAALWASCAKVAWGMGEEAKDEGLDEARAGELALARDKPGGRRGRGGDRGEHGL